ncbi:hypothetical protein AN219_12125 [Streptomyces nanshensis]|nr:hypothetical protein AN219_12125 [Streptomyces nanshensis]
MRRLAKGENAAVGTGRISAELSNGGGLDLSAVLLTARGRVRSDDDLVFYNQPSAESGAVRHFPAGPNGPEHVHVDPAALPVEVDRIVLVASCAPGDSSHTLQAVHGLKISAALMGCEPIEFTVPTLTDGERAVLLLEIYRRDLGWKMRAVGQGYATGLAGLATDFGVSVDNHPKNAVANEHSNGRPKQAARATAVSSRLAKVPQRTPPPPPMSPGKRPLGSISLDKGGHAAISLDKQDRELVFTAALEWNGGSDRRRRLGADLDLYALFVPAPRALRGIKPPGTLVRPGHVPRGDPLQPEVGTSSSSKTMARRGTTTKGQGANVVYYKRLGSLKNRPFIQLSGDSRVPGCESLSIVRPAEHGYILLCAYSAVSNGIGSFRSFGARVVVTDGRGSTITVPLFEATKTRYWVAIALVDFTCPEGVAIRHIEAYSARMTERRPVLHLDGTIEMNGGPVEFKRR